MNANLKPRVVVSKCLGFDHCRYNGEMIEDPLVRKLGEFVDFLPVCPEMGIGLPVPRDPIRVVLVEGRLRLVQPSTGNEYSDKMESFALEHLSRVGTIDGFVLKSRSPSCGTRDVKIYNATGNVLPATKRQGLFGGAVMERFPLAPVEDEGRLKNFLIRERFFAQLFTMARFRELSQEPTMARLTTFHARHKLLVWTYSEKVMRELGRIAANQEHRPLDEVFRTYGEKLPTAFANPAKYTAAINVLMHALGYFKEELAAPEKAFFLDTLERYRHGKLPLSVPTGVLRSWVVRFNEPYLKDQYFFEPYPEALADIADSGKGRDK
jgi:uncharacterized protein YbgA (DUF1722 family)/uncharacterized protein YbbK (DUF523 family)